MQRREFLLGLLATFMLLTESHLAGCAPGASAGPGEEAGTAMPLYAAQITSEAALSQQCAPYLALSTEALAAIAPPQPGFLFSGCPNCQGGTGDDNLAWDISLGDKVQCKYCKVVLPSVEYPENRSYQFRTPTGETQTFRYNQKGEGRKYWFEGRRWFDQRATLEQAAYALAQLYRIDPVKYRDAGVRSLAILTRFAALYPSYIIKYEAPGSDKMFIAENQKIADVFAGRTGGDYASRFSSWRYMDISVPLLLAWDQLADGNFIDAAARQQVEVTLFGGMVDFVAGQSPLPVNNMSPTLWRAQAIASNVLGRPEITADIFPGIRQMLNADFTYDGFWREGTVSYHQQTAGGFQNVVDALYPSLRGDDAIANLERLYPEVARALQVKANFRLPNLHYAAFNDTWGEEKYAPPAIDASHPCLMPGLGYGILGMGRGKDQLQAHLKFTGRFGHHHFDSLNLLLFGAGKELASDIGYTHTKGRPWASSTAAHNTVVVDQLNQVLGEEPRHALGRVQLFNTEHPDFQIVEADAPAAYPGIVSEYRRTLIAVRAPGQAQYVVDLFHVKGGRIHDWVLHGSVEEDQKLELTTADGTPLPGREAASLLPEGYQFKPAESENDGAFVFDGPWAYGNFRDITQAQTGGTVIATFRPADGSPGGLQSWVMGGVDSTCFTTRSATVRGVRDQAQLEKSLRSSLIVRRGGGESSFIAVHVPFEKSGVVRRVIALPWPEGGIALRIEHAGGSDTVIYQNDAVSRSGQLDGKPLRFDGRVALLRRSGNKVQVKTVGGTLLRLASNSLPNSSGAVRLLDVRGDRLTVQGKHQIARGSVIVVRHGNGETSAFHVAEAAGEGANTSIRTEEPAVFTGPASGTLKMSFFPHLTFPGPHTVELNPAASQAFTW